MTKSTQIQNNEITCGLISSIMHAANASFVLHTDIRCVYEEKLSQNVCITLVTFKII